MALARRLQIAARHFGSSAEAGPISVHKGLKIQGALCVERPPLEALEAKFSRSWRLFKEAWELRTNNHLTLEDEIVFMRFHFHFFQDKSATDALASDVVRLKTLARGGGRSRRRGPVSQLASSSASTEQLLASMGPASKNLSSLLEEQGLDLEFPELGRKAATRKKVQRQKEEAVDDSDRRSLRRLSSRSLFLLVRYDPAKRWTFPKADRVHGQAMRETLLGLAQQQLGQELRPWLVGACPFSYRKRFSNLHCGIQGRKIFYYRARLVPGSTVQLPDSTPVADWAWCARQELQELLDEGEWQAVRDSLPLDDVSELLTDAPRLSA
ncbi:unnamed protein product [Effrenium voratum]|uniref:Mitochondrial ribosomal protein L46 n=1 Tax=Effrenium voratum TaxID=2562239 RepID=A0AA36IEL7_9DINO|nr:unnamed protein product [Effrenium voratum]CAJ1385301.1 unnamed protein product [Effrenium voratum]CAJ1454968.1 unnamed protein product [Effrenium voratum]